jgi:hypothetical protein
MILVFINWFGIGTISAILRLMFLHFIRMNYGLTRIFISFYSFVLISAGHIEAEKGTVHYSLSVKKGLSNCHWVYDVRVRQI